MLYYFIMVFLFAVQPLHAENNEEGKYESEIRVVPPKCLQLLSSHRGGGGIWVMEFQNVCGKSFYANACVEERPSQYRLHQSGAKIPKYGYWTIFSYEGYEPLSAHLATGPGAPGIPGPCGAKER